MPAVRQWENLLLMRTLSKFGLAGLRLGLMVGHPAWIGELDKVRLPYNINVLTQVSAEFALSHGDLFEAQTRRIREDRARLYDALRQRQGVRPWPSWANFLLFRTLDVEGTVLFEGLRKRGVLVMNLSGSGPSLRNCLRVTVGTPEDNRQFLAALDNALTG